MRDRPKTACWTMTNDFQVQWTDEEGSRSVWLSGEVDLTSEGDLRQSLDSGRPRLLVDLRHVTFIDLSGLRCLVDAAAKHEVVALRTSPRVDRLLELTATGHLFEIERPFGDG